MGFRHMEQEAPALAARDHLGRWRRGVSGNPIGRPRGSKNRLPRRRADLAQAQNWTRHDWQTFYNRALKGADGGFGDRHAAAVSETIALWLLLHPPVQRVGLCAQCAGALDLPVSSINGAPVRADGAWLHWCCLPPFLRARWDVAKVALQRLGIAIGKS